MRGLIGLGLFVCLQSLASLVRAQTVIHEVDICIYGGTASGVIASYTAKMMQKSVIVIEPGNVLGAPLSNGEITTDVRSQHLVSGLAKDFYRRAGLRYGRFEAWDFEPHVAGEVFEDYISEAAIPVIRNVALTSVKKVSNALVSLTVRGKDDSVEYIIRAKMFMDCSLEGSLMVAAQVSHDAGIPVSLLEEEVVPYRIDAFRVRQKSASMYAPGNGKDFNLSGNIVGFHYRPCLTDEPRRKIPFERPIGYDSTKYDFVLRVLASVGTAPVLEDLFHIQRIANKKAIFSPGGFFAAMLSTNALHGADVEKLTKTVASDHENFVRGLLFFLSNDLRVPFSLRQQTGLWGYASDEFIEDNHWPHRLWIQGNNRLNGMARVSIQKDHQVHKGDIITRTSINATLPIAWTVRDGKIISLGLPSVDQSRDVLIPLQALLPHEEEAINFLVPVCFSADPEVSAGINAGHLQMRLGQAVAVTAVKAIENQVPVQQVSVSDVRHELERNPLADQSRREITVDNRDVTSSAIPKQWKSLGKGGFNQSYNFSDFRNGNKRRNSQRIHVFRFTPNDTVVGNYDIYMYVPSTKSCSEFLTVRVSDGSRVSERVVNTTVISKSASGDWVFLGRHNIKNGRRPYVEVTDLNADGRVVADAVTWVPAGDETTVNASGKFKQGK